MNFYSSVERRQAASDLSPEYALLLAASGINYDREVPRWAERINGLDICWKDLLVTAELQGVQPLLWRFLGQFGADVIPANVLADLREAAQANTMRNLKMTGELAAVLDNFAACGIAVAPFKGPSLALLAQGDLAWREFGDLDVLVHRESLPRAGELLLELGYEAEFDLTNLRDRVFLRVCNALSFYHRRKDVLIELHWELSPQLFPFELRVEAVMARLQTVSPAGRQMRTLSNEALLLYLCSHGARHCWSSLGWIADIAWLVHRQATLNWDELNRLARATKTQRVLWLGLLLAEKLLGANVPAEIAGRMLADARVGQSAEQVCHWLFHPDKSAPGVMERDWFYLRLQDNWVERAGYLFRLLTVPNVSDWQFMALPRPLTFLYPALRPVRFFRDQIQSIQTTNL